MAKKKKTKETPKKAKKASKPDWAPPFLAALRGTANIYHSAIAAGIARSEVYKRRDKDKAFAADMTSAIEDAVDDLELEARRRARHGLVRVKFHQGEPIMVPLLDESGQPRLDMIGRPVLIPYVEHEYSDTLMIFLLKAHRPQKYRENFKLEHSGPDGGPIPHEVSITARIDAYALAIENEVDREEAGHPPGDGARE